MHRTATLLVAVAFTALGFTSTASAVGPFGKLHRNQCCDAGCDSGCETDACDAVACADDACDSDPCAERGCDSDPCAMSCEPKKCGRCGCEQRRWLRNDCCSARCKYWSLFGGWQTLDDYTGERENPFPAPPTQLDGSFSDGWAIGIARGRRFNRALRGEIEFSFRSNTADTWLVAGAPQQWSGHLYTYANMANLYHDFDRWQLAGFSPYVGGGIGVAVYDGDFQTAATSLEIDDTEFAYQFIAGGSKRLNCNLDLFAEYRFFGSTEVTLNDTTPPPPNVRLGTLEPEFHNVFIGLRLNR